MTTDAGRSERSRFTPCRYKESCHWYASCFGDCVEIDLKCAQIDVQAKFTCARGYDHESKFAAYVADQSEQEVRSQRDVK